MLDGYNLEVIEGGARERGERRDTRVVTSDRAESPTALLAKRRLGM